jgi:hypothetical protein
VTACVRGPRSPATFPRPGSRRVDGAAAAAVPDGAALAADDGWAPGDPGFVCLLTARTLNTVATMIARIHAFVRPDRPDNIPLLWLPPDPPTDR